MLYYGIDVSAWQGEINWKKVKESKQVDFAIIKAGGSDSGFYRDSKFDYNYTRAKNEGIPVGAYYFVGPGCISTEDGVADAKRFCEILKPKEFEYPVFIDLESTAPKHKKGATDAVIGFCKTMEDNGYFCGVYSSAIHGFRYQLEDERILQYAHWIADWSSTLDYAGDYGIWQYSSSGKIPGIKTLVDLNVCHVNYPALIVGKYNNTKKAEKKKKPSNTTIAKEVIAGKWGNGIIRRKRLEKAGYDYEVIQKIVNKLMENK